MEDKEAGGAGTEDGQAGAGTQNNTTTGEKMVPERDLIQAKRSLEDQIKGLKESHAGIVDSLNSQVNSLTNEKTQLEAKVQTLEESAGSTQAASEEMEKLKTQLAEKEESIQKLHGVLVSTKTERLISMGVPKDKLANRTIDELNLLEDALGSVASVRSGNGYVSGTSGSGGSEPKSRLEQAAALIAQAETRLGPVTVTSEARESGEE